MCLCVCVTGVCVCACVCVCVRITCECVSRVCVCVCVKRVQLAVAELLSYIARGGGDGCVSGAGAPLPTKKNGSTPINTV